MPSSWDWVGIIGLAIAILALCRTVVRDRDDDSRRVKGEGARLRSQGRDKRKLAATETSAELLEEIRDLMEANPSAVFEAVRDGLKRGLKDLARPELDSQAEADRRRFVGVIDANFPGLPPSGVVQAQAGPATTNIQGEVIRKDDPYHPRLDHHTPADLD